MIKKFAQKASLLVLLQLVTLQSTSNRLSSVYSFSISSPHSKNGANSNLRHNNLQNVMQSSLNSVSSSSSHQQQQSANLQLTTVQPPAMTTQQQLNSISYLDSFATQYQSKQPQQQQQQQQAQNQQVDDLHQASERSSSGNEDHDDTVPLATINNHSRNNQPVVRPPQYVDVSALVGVSVMKRNKSKCRRKTNQCCGCFEVCKER